MKRFLIVILALSIAGVAFAADVNTSNTQTEVIKDGHSDGVMLPTVREGGEDIASAVVIAGLPFNDTGLTCDNVDDYDETCPYGGSTAPDVVYSYTPAADGAITIDLCNSLYDTKVFVYENVHTPGVPYACNDDYYTGAPCFAYSSAIIAMPVTGGNTYFIVVDGYGGGCGEYNLDIIEDTPPEPCVVDCPADALDEGEGPVSDGYVDTFNGGCNSVPPVYTALTVEAGGCTTICGLGGFYSGGRDTDWYEFVAPTDITGIVFQGESFFDVFMLEASCDPIVAVDGFSTGACDDDATEYSFATVAGTTYWIFVGVQFDTGTAPDIDYVMSVCGFDVVATENATWGGVKSLFR